MSFNIVDLIKEQISDKTMGSIGGALGVQSTQVSSGLAGALPGLLSGLVSSTDTKQGAGALFDAVQQQDDGLLGNIGNLLGGNDSSNLASTGTSTLSSLLGSGAVGSLVGAVSNLAGLERGNSGSLVGMLAPIILGVLKKKVFDGGMDSSSFTSMLTSQKDNVNAAMPQGFTDQLQSGGFFDSIADTSGNVNQAASPSVSANNTNTSHTAELTTETHVETAKSGGGFMKWLLPVVVVAVLGWLAMQFLGGKSVEEAGNGLSDSVSEAAGSTGTAVEGALESATDALPDGVNLDEITGGLDGVFSSATDALGGITDVESATAAIPALEEIGGSLGGLSDTIGGLPDAAKGPIASVVGTGIEALQPIIEKVTAIPGVGDLITPVIEPMMEMLQGLAG